MAVLSSTSPGQLGKYVIPTVQNLNTAMKKGTPVKRGSGRSFRIKDNQANVNAINEFSRMGINPKQQKASLDILLEVTDTKQKAIKIGSVDKPNIKYNLGDMAEGVIGAAIVARFIYKNRNINERQVFGVLRSMPPGKPKTGKKGLETTKDFKSANENPKVMDDVNFYLSLAEVNMTALLLPGNEDLIRPYVRSAVRYANSTNVRKWSKLLYENNRYDKIEVVSDGLGGQTTTKVDVFVKVDGKPIDIQVSLKAGDVKQFGQVSGVEFAKQEKLWETTFGYKSDIAGLKTKYEEFVTANQVPQAVSLVYNKVAAEFNKDMSTNKKNEVIRSLAESIKYFATLNEDDVVLLQVANDAAKLYSFDNIADGLKNLRLQAQVTFGKTGLPTLLIINADTGQPIIQYRVKQEFKPDGSPYVRNYVEKQKELGSIIGQQL
jgi:hypothetical protein